MERAAFDRLLTATLPEIEQAARKYSVKNQCHQEWQDLAQSAILKILRYAEHYDPAKGALLQWACVTVINTIKSHVAKTTAYSVMENYNDIIIEQTPATNDRNPENELQAAFILDNLNREAHLFAEGYNYREIAARCGVKSKSTIRERIDNCAKRLSLFLEIKASGKRPCMYAKTSG